jgi:ATP-binding cassette, subfamily B, bacterial
MPNEQLDPRAGAGLVARCLRAEWPSLVIGMVCALVWSAARLGIPILTAYTIDHALPGSLGSSGGLFGSPISALAHAVRWGGGHRIGLLAALALLIVGFAGVQGLAAAARRYFAMRTSYRIEADLRRALYNRVNRLSFDYYDRTATGQLMSRASADLHEIQQFVVAIPINFAALLMAAGAFLVMLSVHAGLAFSALCVYPVVLLVTVRFFTRLFPATARVQQGLADLSGVVEENVAGARLVRAFGREEHEIGKLQRVADDIFRNNMEVARMRTLYTPLFSLLPSVGQLVIISYGGWLVLQGQVTIGQFVMFMQFLNMLIWPVQMMGEQIASGQRAITSAARVWNVLREEPTVRERPHARPLPAGPGEVVFDHVRFAYQTGRPVLHDFSLRVPAGMAVALVGPTGCGKSTVARLLPRFYDIDSGSISIDGVDVRELKLHELRRNVGLVFEDTFLFSDSIRNNIAYGRLDAHEDEIQHAAQLAQASEFVDQAPDTYDTIVGEQGFSLSGGQRQRIAIARAVLMQPRVLILDDATSSVDARMEEEIRSALRRVMEGRTTIIISHRLSTISLADQVVLMDEGRVAAIGTHDELLAKSSAYSEVLGQLELVS